MRGESWGTIVLLFDLGRGRSNTDVMGRGEVLKPYRNRRICEI
jgi:hypothetical protein